MNHPLLVHMTDEEFADLPNKVVPRTIRLKDPSFESQDAVEWIFIGYCEKLLGNNKPLQDWLQRFGRNSDSQNTEISWTKGQRILDHLAIFDGQVKNGGLAQFFWNCPELIVGTHEALTEIDETQLSHDYDKAVEDLVGNIEGWNQLREQSAKDPTEFWESFRSSYNLLNLDWFDTAYFQKYGPVLIAQLVDYVKTHKSEFIAS